MLITAQLLLNFQRCARRAFLEVYGDPEQKIPPSDFLLKLAQDSQAHQQMVLDEQDWVQPIYPKGDWKAGAQATLELMQQGVEQIYQGVLLVEEAGDVMVSTPDLLTRQSGLSDFGDWLYVPTEIKLSKRPKLEYQIILSFHTYLLASVQGAWPETAWLWLREKGLYSVDLWRSLPLMQEQLAELVDLLKTGREPEVFISRSQCSHCTWYEHCYGLAQSQQHLSLLPGVTASRYTVLQQHRLTTVEALASIAPQQLEALPGFGRDVADKLVRQARSTLHNHAIPLPTLPPDTLPTAPIELYFDIEAEPGLDLVFLHGILVVDRAKQSQTFYPLVAECPEAEEQAWYQFLELVHSYPTAPIFHFCPYETQTVERLAQLYRTPNRRIKPLLSRCIDLHQWVTQTVTLPIESYTLKLIARWIGFQWRDAQANGAQAIYWYTQWLQTGDRQFLNAIIDYNEDDCRATHRVKDWLVEFLSLHQLPANPDLITGNGRSLSLGNPDTNIVHIAKKLQGCP